jgi:hypothetical protein
MIFGNSIRMTVCASALLALGMLCGCQVEVQPAQPPQPTPQTLDKIQADYASQAPDMPVGRVTAVVSDVRLAAVDHVTRIETLQQGDDVTFVDASGQIVNHGKIVRLNPPFVDVQYDAGGPRAPRQGDLMVKVKL